jgi:group I intron endonuclease
MTSKFLIYALCEPDTGAIRYIGKSSSGLKRARAHEYAGNLKRSKGLCRNWIVSLHNKGLRPLAEVVEYHTNHADLIEAEKFYISYFRSLGFNLTNMTDGGEGCPGRKLSKEARERLRQVNLGNKHSLGKKKAPVSKEVRLRMSERNKLRMKDPAVRQNISNKLTGLKQSKETIGKRQRNMVGKREKWLISKDGQKFTSQKEAARFFNITEAYISKMLNGSCPNLLGVSRVEKK